MRSALGMVLLGIAVVVVVGCNTGENNGPGGAAAVKKLEAGGSTFINPQMDEWAKVYARQKGVTVDYAGGGSGKGVTQMIQGTYDFGCTDAPMNEKQLDEARAKGGDVIHVPLILGAVVPGYNLKGLSEPLKFTGPVLADIFLGKITRWNDKALRDVNPGVNLPDQDVVVVHRAEPSGTTFIWTNYLAKVSEEWKTEVGNGTEVKWKVGTGQTGNDGVTGLIAATPGTIGYLEVGHAIKNKDKLEFGSVQNAKGKFVRGDDTAAVSAAAEGVEIPDNLCLILTDSDNANAYPIVGCTWAVFYQKQKADKGRAVVDFLRWAVHDGQKVVMKPDYASLPDKLVGRIDQKLQTVGYDK